MFGLPAAIAYNTETERRFLKGELGTAARAEETVGCGVDLPATSLLPVPERPSDGGRRGRDGRRQDRDRGRRADVETPRRAPGQCRRRQSTRRPKVGTTRTPSTRRGFAAARRGERFRRRHRLYGNVALYGGRIDPGKGCEELFEYFTAYRERGGDAALALMGVKLMAIPEVPYVRFAGQLSDDERVEALEAATVIVVPSPFESLSLLALESFAVGTPDPRQRPQRRPRRPLPPQQRRPVLRDPRRVRGGDDAPDDRRQAARA